MQWSEVLNDPSLKDLPYKIELDQFGRILMSPASNRHGIQQARLVRLLAGLLDAGEIATECSIATHKCVKVADVVWMSADFCTRQAERTPYTEAPELCIEIPSPSTSASEMEDQIHLYLGYGALEVWLVDANGRISLHGAEGQRSASKIAGLSVPESI